MIWEGSLVGKGAGVRVQAGRLLGESVMDMGWSVCMVQLVSVVWFSERGFGMA